MSLSPNVPEERESYHYESASTPRWVLLSVVVLFVLVAILSYAGYAERARLEADLAKSTDRSNVLSAQLDQANARLADLKAHVEGAEQKLGMTRTELARAASRAESIRKEQKTADEQLSAQLGKVKQESEEKIGYVASEVGGAKKEIEATKSDLEVTKGKLERVIGDAGVMSGLIARNREDLEVLRRRGERNIFEFDLQRSKSPQRVGPVQLALNKADAKKQRYTLTVYADDKAIEKKDRSANEPIQFYVNAGGAGRELYEVVVFNVAKDHAAGYLTTPKNAAAAAAKPASQ
jgi:chromosome segregation ATPase